MSEKQNIIILAKMSPAHPFTNDSLCANEIKHKKNKNPKIFVKNPTIESAPKTKNPKNKKLWKILDLARRLKDKRYVKLLPLFVIMNSDQISWPKKPFGLENI